MAFIFSIRSTFSKAHAALLLMVVVWLVLTSCKKNSSPAPPVVTPPVIARDSFPYLTDTTGSTSPDAYEDYHLVWQDEFNGTLLDETSWQYETGNGPGGWGNNELEYYTPGHSNAFTKNGRLVIEARNENVSGFNYTSARITTKGKRSFRYGRIDIRAKLPSGQGIWPALWMLGENVDTVGWPACGEIDIMELLGQAPNKVYGTLHWGPDWTKHESLGRSYSMLSSFAEQYHVFSLLWEPDHYQILVDNVAFLSATSTDITAGNNPFNKPQFFIFNLAVGGNWPGSPNATTIFPQRLLVDYVRVFQH